MATPTGTYAFSPSLADLVLFAFNSAGIRPTSLSQEHMVSARMAANLMCSRWSNDGVNLWQVDLQIVTLVEGQATYTVPANTVVILDAYLGIVNSASQEIDRLILPISRSEYATYANKDQQGFSTVYWHDRLLSPTVTLWPVPDGTSATYLKYYRLIQLQDANIVNGAGPDIPYLWMEAFAYGLAFRLAAIWNPPMAAPLKIFADESYAIAAARNIEIAQQFISPDLSSYYRN